MTTAAPPIESITTGVYTFPTPEPEADGTLQWSSTTAVSVTLRAGGQSGWGWTYTSPAAASVIVHHLAGVVHGRDAFAVDEGWEAMRRAGRNFGTRGLYMQALSAVDIAWWDLKSRLLDVALCDLFGRYRDEVPIYGSGGFTTLDETQLAEQVAWWRAVGCRAAKIKIGQGWGHNVDRDLDRVRQLAELAGPDVALMVDANGAYTRKQARRVGQKLDDLGVSWFEEPVSSDDLDGLAALSASLACDVAAGEYAADLFDVRNLVPVVDCLQLDATRCGGYTGFLRGVAVAAAHNLDISAHCAPSLHAHVCAAIPKLRHLEWFADHVRVEALLAHGAPQAEDGHLRISPGIAGHGMTLSPDAEKYRVR